ncbi:thioredoxin domain-containing protein 12-like isoform X2 [Haliotis asinina]|uniref:thioredoxin domain-containing protein 12-like isoform X2 n=1 Tax=Haliotis asinina TaxID=109174 RepID=UPI00353245FB
MADTGMLAWISVIVFTCLTLSRANQYARGWGDDIDWVNLQDGLAKAKEQNKPLMLVIHKSWCGACKALKPKFAETKDIISLSKQFIMVNTENEEEPSEKQYSPDGGYIPRILFLDPEGNVRKEFINENGNDKYRYYYPDTEDIVTSMNKVLQAVEDGKLATGKSKTEL